VCWLFSKAWNKVYKWSIDCVWSFAWTSFVADNGHYRGCISSRLVVSFSDFVLPFSRVTKKIYSLEPGQLIILESLIHSFIPQIHPFILLHLMFFCTSCNFTVFSSNFHFLHLLLYLSVDLSYFFADLSLVINSFPHFKLIIAKSLYFFLLNSWNCCSTFAISIVCEDYVIS